MSTKHVPSRKEVDPQRTWNDISVFATVDDWSAEVAKLAAELPELRQWQGRLAEGPSVLADALQAMNEYYQRFGKALVYAYMSEAVDTGDQAATARAGQVFSLFGQVRGATAFLDPELLAIGRERLTNPFLRPDSPELQATLGLRGASLIEVFAETRRRRNEF